MCRHKWSLCCFYFTVILITNELQAITQVRKAAKNYKYTTYGTTYSSTEPLISSTTRSPRTIKPPMPMLIPSKVTSTQRNDTFEFDWLLHDRNNKIQQWYHMSIAAMPLANNKKLEIKAPANVQNHNSINDSNLDNVLDWLYKEEGNELGNVIEQLAHKAVEHINISPTTVVETLPVSKNATRRYQDCGKKCKSESQEHSSEEIKFQIISQQIGKNKNTKTKPQLILTEQPNLPLDTITLTSRKELDNKLIKRIIDMVRHFNRLY